MYKIQSEWLKYAKGEEEKEGTKQTVLNADPAFAILRKLLEDRRRAVPSITEKEYERADWAALQAHRNGRMQEIDHLLKLLTFKERP